MRGTQVLPPPFNHRVENRSCESHGGPLRPLRQQYGGSGGGRHGGQEERQAPEWDAQVRHLAMRKLRTRLPRPPSDPSATCILLFCVRPWRGYAPCWQWHGLSRSSSRETVRPLGSLLVGVRSPRVAQAWRQGGVRKVTTPAGLPSCQVPALRPAHRGGVRAHLGQRHPELDGAAGH